MGVGGLMKKGLLGISNSLYKETMSKNRQALSEKPTSDDGEMFGILPRSVLANLALTSAAKVVFAALGMLSYRNGYEVAMSHNSIAQIAGMHRTTAMEALLVLEDHGLLERKRCGKTGVQTYRLVHPRLPVGKKADAPKAAPASSAVKGSKAVEGKLKICGKCKRGTKWLSKLAGICRQCVQDGKIRRIAREEVAARSAG